MNIESKEIKLVPVDQIKPHHLNANKHSKEQIDRLAKIIEYSGFRQPLVVSNRSGLLISGHGRLEAAVQIGMSQVPVIYEDFEDEAMEFQHLTADNAIAAWAELDMEKIKLDALELNLDTNGFDLDLLGVVDLDLSLPDPDKDAIEDDIPEPTQSISKLGDLYELGEHRLLCGDSTDKATVERLMNGIKPLLMITDPPYGVNYDAEWRKEALGDKFMGKVNKNKVSNDDNADWTEVWRLSGAQVFYIWHASQFDHIVKESLEKSDYEVRQQIIWNKTVAAMSRSAYHWKHEPCLYGVKKGSDANWLGDRKQNTVWDAASPIHIMSGSKDDKTTHPTQKPIVLYEKAILNHMTTKDYVYDPFAGSGSVVIACEKTKRKCFMMELDPHYIDVIVSRWCKYTGKKEIKRNGEPMEWTI